MTGLIRATSMTAIAFRLSSWTYAMATRSNFLKWANNPLGIKTIARKMSNGFIQGDLKAGRS